MIKKILIVGSGPAAFGFLSAIKDKSKYNFFLIDNSDIKSRNKGCTFEKNFITGSRLQLESSGNPLISNHFGGFSNFWGGTYDDPHKKIKDMFLDINIDIDKYLKITDKLVPRYIFSNNNKSINNTLTYNSILKDQTLRKFSKNGLKIKKSEIATNQSRLDKFSYEKICNFCGEVESFCREDSIWNSKHYINNLIDSGDIKYLKNSYLHKFKENDNKVFCEIFTDETKSDYVFEKLILATGPISTAEIVLKSQVIEKVNIKTTDLVQVPFIKFFKTEKKKHSFSDLFSSINVLDHQTYQQYYFFSNTVLKLSRNAFKLSRLLNFVPDTFLSIVGGIFVTFESNMSSEIEMSYYNNSIVSRNINGSPLKRKRILNQLFKVFLKSKMLLLLPLKKAYLDGTSYHNGAQFPIHENASNKTSDKYGRISNLQNTHIVDSSVLPDINTGPGVKLIIANSYRIGSSF